MSVTVTNDTMSFNGTDYPIKVLMEGTDVYAVAPLSLYNKIFSYIDKAYALEYGEEPRYTSAQEKRICEEVYNIDRSIFYYANDNDFNKSSEELMKLCKAL